MPIKSFAAPLFYFRDALAGSRDAQFEKPLLYRVVDNRFRVIDHERKIFIQRKNI